MAKNTKEYLLEKGYSEEEAEAVIDRNNLTEAIKGSLTTTNLLLIIIAISTTYTAFFK